MNPASVHAAAARNSAMASRRMLRAWWLLLLSCLGGMLSPTQASEDSGYWIDACASPLTLILQGLPSVAGVSLETTFDTCREQAAYEIPMHDPGSDARTWLAQASRMPTLAWVPRNGMLDVRVVLRDGPEPRVYEGTQIASGSKNVALQRVGHEGGPALSVSVQRTEGPPIVAMNVVDAKSSDVLRDLVRIKHLKVRHAGRVTDIPVTFRFQSMQVRAVLGLLADISGVVLHRDGSEGYVFGLNPHAAEIEALRAKAFELSAETERVELVRTLQRIVELSKSAIEGEPGVPVADVLEQLAAMAMDDADPARAEALQRARMFEIEQSWSGADSATYAMALADLARARLAQGDRSGATPMFERALAILAKGDHERSAAGARVLGDLGTLALTDQRLDAAADYAKRGFVIVSRVVEGYDEDSPLMLLRARLLLGNLESELGDVFVQREQPVVADAHLERALLLDEVLWGIDDELTIPPRQRFTANAWRMGRPSRAAAALVRRIEHAETTRDAQSFGYASALANLAAIRASEGNNAAALVLARRYIVAVEHANGRQSARALSALRFSALMHRLDRQFEEAARIERRAAATEPDADGAGGNGVLPPEPDMLFDTVMAWQLATYLEDRLREKGLAAPGDGVARACLKTSAKPMRVPATRSRLPTACIKRCRYCAS